MKKVNATKHTPAFRASFSISPEQQIDLLNGFLEGSELKKIVPDVSDCTANMTSVVNAIRQAYADFNKTDPNFTDIADGIQMIGVAIQGLSNATRSCKNLPTAFKTIINYVGKIIADPSGWFAKVTKTAAGNSAYIMWDFYSLQSLIGTDKYKDIGFKLGEILKYVFKVDMGQYFVMMINKGEGKKLDSGIDISKLVQCGYKLFDVVKKAEPIVEDLIQHPENMITAIAQFAGFVKELEESCNGVFNVKKLAKQATNTLLAMNKKRGFGKMPSVDDLITCVKSVKPVAVDIYDAIVNFKDGKTKEALDNLEKLSLDALKLGYSCYAVIKDIFDDS